MKKNLLDSGKYLLHIVVSLLLGFMIFDLISDKGINDFLSLADYNLYRFMGGIVWTLPVFLLIGLCRLGMSEDK